MSIETLLEAAKFLELQAQQQQKTREENELRERLRQEQEAEQRKRTEAAAAAQAVRVNSNHHHHHHHNNQHITWVEEPSGPERRLTPLPPQPPPPSLPITVIPIPVVPSAAPAPQAAFTPAPSAARSPPNVHQQQHHHHQQRQGQVSPRKDSRSPPNGQHPHPQHVLISPQPQPEPGEPTTLAQPPANKHQQQQQTPHLVQSYPGTIVAASQHAMPPQLSSPQSQAQAQANAAARASPPDDGRHGDGKKRPGGAGTREVHNKLEKNRRAHLKECFETLKKNIPNVDEKKASNLSVLRSALRYIQLNLIFLVITMYKMVKHTTSLKPDSSRLENINNYRVCDGYYNTDLPGYEDNKPFIKSWVLGAFALLFLLILTWSFGLFFISESSVVMAYLFTIFNTFQGMFIFIFYCLLQKKVRKEYSKCFRHTYCCGGLPTESSHSSTKTSTTRTSARYSSGTQSRIRRMWNDTVRKQSESSFISGDINSTSTLNQGMTGNYLLTNPLLRPQGTNNPYNTLLAETVVCNTPAAPVFNSPGHSLNTKRQTNAMDTLPLNGNFNNSYSLRNGDFGDSVQVVDCGLSIDDAAFEKMIISELVHNNLRACNKTHNTNERTSSTKVAVGGGSSSEDDAIMADASSLVHADNPRLELHQRELEAPLIPQRTHSLLYPPQDKGKLECMESYISPMTPDTEDNMQSPNRDSLYTSMPNLRDSPYHECSPDIEEDLSPSKQSESEDVYYKSMPNLGAGQQLHAYYQINKVGDGYIIPINKDGCIPEGDVREGQMQLVTSL